MKSSKGRLEQSQVYGENENGGGGDPQSFVKEIGGEDTRELRHLLTSYMIRKELG